MIKAISSTFSLQVEMMSSTSLCTIGLPAIGINGLGVVSVWGRIRLPIPAIGIIMFMDNVFNKLVYARVAKTTCAS